MSFDRAFTAAMAPIQQCKHCNDDANDEGFGKDGEQASPAVGQIQEEKRDAQYPVGNDEDLKAARLQWGLGDNQWREVPLVAQGCYGALEVRSQYRAYYRVRRYS